MMRSINSREGRIKRVPCGSKGGLKRGYTGAKRKVYSCFFARARDLLSVTLFFLILIGFKGCSLYNTVLENLYDNIL
jgi:hypothetical protein